MGTWYMPIRYLGCQTAFHIPAAGARLLLREQSAARRKRRGWHTLCNLFRLPPGSSTAGCIQKHFSRTLI